MRLRLQAHKLILILLALVMLALPVQAAGEVQVAPAKNVEKLISLQLKGSDIRDVLQMMAKIADINVVSDKSVVGEVSVSLKEVPFDQALELVVKANGFDYRWVGEILMVASADRMATALEEPLLQTFSLKNISSEEAKRAASLVVDPSHIVSEPGSNVLVVKMLPSQLGTINRLIESIDVARNAPLSAAITKVIPLKYTEAEDILEALRKAAGEEVVIVPRGKAIVIRGPEEQVQSIQDFLASLDQAGLESTESESAETAVSKISEPAEEIVTRIVNLDHATTSAAKEAMLLVLPEESVRVLKEDRTLAIRGTKAEIEEAMRVLAQVDQPIRQVLIEARVEEMSVDALNELGVDWDVHFDSGIRMTSVTDIAKNNFSLAKEVPDFSAALKILEENGESVVLANPRVAVLDGGEANIHIGDRIPMVIDKKETDANGNVVITTSIEYIDVGIILSVMPRINNQGLITTDVQPEVSTIVGETAQGYPQIRTRKAQTRMTLVNGETMVLGGLIQEEEIKSLKKVPVLGDLPVLGKLFQTETTDKQQTEIVIFLTPTIISSPVQ